LTCRSGQTNDACSLALVRGRAEWADLVGVDADGSVVLAEDDSRDVLSDILRTDVGVKWDVRGALEVMCVLVEAHFCRLVLLQQRRSTTAVFGSRRGGLFAVTLR
jgi:hypothetical protein